jgi:UDP-glucuronate decarboxylase
VKVLVTGGAGFVGSHLVARLLRDGHHVTALDDLSTGSWSNLDAVRGDPNVELVEHDVCKPYTTDAERIYNLACPASPPRYRAAPIRTTLASVFGTLFALREGERTGARVLQASTSEVYGDPEVHPQPEEYRGRVNPVGPRSCYDEGKRCAESLCADFARLGIADVRIARIFNTYGPRMALDDGRVVVTFVRQALSGEPLTIHGDGTQTRSLCHVDDLVNGLVALMEETDHQGPVNLGNPEETTVLALAHAVRALVSQATFAFVPPRDEDPARRCPDIRLARELFGFAPRVSLAEGLASMVEDVERRLAAR